MRDNSSWGVGNSGGFGGNNWGMSSIGGNWGMSIGGNWGMSIGGDNGGGVSISRDNGGGMSVGGDNGSGVSDNWSVSSVGGDDGSVSYGKSIIGDTGVVFANAREGTVYGFGVGGHGLVASEGADDALVRRADGWGVDGDWGGVGHGNGGGVSVGDGGGGYHGGGLVDVSAADSWGGGVGHGWGSDETGVGVSQSSGEDYELKFFKCNYSILVVGAWNSL
ncbi:hypothetical protein TcasGA2_TC000370 [Tribolium castaneum]|uniref:Uncharacterized protein n=1 Tax=Tribolium castaneum TaxID=7070 RepID=D6WAM2_TRICA|nr:hypothetical protein TcasGA2_TC000370 [Tribolium castaneum]